MQSTLESIEYCKLLISSSRVMYEHIGIIECPILKEKVVFNARGFHHLLNNSDGTPRDVNEIIHKLKLLPLAKVVVQNATSIHEERNIKIRESRKKNAKIKEGKTYSLTARVGKKKPIEVRVILLKIGNGNLMFRSVMKH